MNMYWVKKAIAGTTLASLLVLSGSMLGTTAQAQGRNRSSIYYRNDYQDHDGNGQRDYRTNNRDWQYNENRNYNNYESDRSWQRQALIIGGGAGAGAGIGALASGKKGALIGAAIGGGAGLVYNLLTRHK